MRIVRYTTLLFFVCIGLPLLKAQSKQLPIPCATPPFKSSWLTEFQKRQNRPELRSNEFKYVAMSIHIVGTNEGKHYLNFNTVLDALCMLNEKFVDVGLQFFVKDDFHYINNDILFAHDKMSFPQVPTFFSLYNIPNTVNVYFVSDPMGACGYNYMPGGKSMAIVLSNDCTNGKDANWAHEMGHYLSLPHTFYGWEMQTADLNKPAPQETLMGVEVELANGSNCALAGDGFCDTPADYLSARWECDSKGVSVAKQMDPKGSYFCSDGSLIMSYSAETCANRFSPGQATAMHNYLAEELHGYSMSNAPCEKIAPILSDNLEFPGNRVALNTPNRRVFFKWKSVPNASGYLLEISLLANFGTAVFRGYTRDTSFEVSNLSSSRPYYWRIRPFNAMYSCRNFSSMRSFTINQTTTALPDLSTVHALKLFPNPVSRGAEIHLRFEADDNLKLELTLRNAFGQSVHQQNFRTSVGQNEVVLRPNPLPAGFYYLWLKGENGAISRSLVIQ